MISEAHLSTIESFASAIDQMANAYSNLSRYDCDSAIAVIQKFPIQLRSSPWGLSLLAKCWFQKTNYEKAAKCFRQALDCSRFRTRDMMVYSTTLWYLGKEVELSFLAKELSQGDRNSADCWITVGNCFSLQREHQTALKFFKRAAEVDPTCAYAFTLAAHELVASEDFDSAIVYYRKALTVDQNHFNAWYGLGKVFFRQEKYDLAINHFKKAIAINGQNSVLHSDLGLAYFKLNDVSSAEKHFQVASNLQPLNAVVKFHRARLFRSLGKHSLAAGLLKEVLRLAPLDDKVHRELGSLLAEMGLQGEAIFHLSRALDLNPKEKSQLKVQIESLQLFSSDRH